MIRRPRRSVPAVVVALAVFALCLVTVISLIQRLTGGRELVSYDALAIRLHDIEWTDAIVAVVGVVAMALGLLLLVAALLPGRPVVVPLADLDGSAAGVTRRSVRSALAREVDALPGVAAHRIKVGRGKIRVAATHAHPAASDPAPAWSDLAPVDTGMAPVASAVPVSPVPAFLPEEPGAQPRSAPSPDGRADRVSTASRDSLRAGADDAVADTVSRALKRIGMADSRVRTQVRAARRGARR
ncbi:DUF6286 domain-containing protein [Nocardia concava]|uniref:DUF6286 domain-containing protein n=1 Tax=Nocardia concava TaxID=257281 RepID=UPI00030BF2AD|nr:DUF6286 domain-containing protein [Nocardia concava]